MTLSDKSKNAIDALTLEELRAEVLLDKKSRYQGDKADYVLVRFGQLQEEKRDIERAEDTASADENIKIAKEANDISRKANKFSKLAIWVSVFALIISLWSFLHDVRVSNNTSIESINEQKP